MVRKVAAPGVRESASERGGAGGRGVDVGMGSHMMNKVGVRKHQMLGQQVLFSCHYERQRSLAVRPTPRGLGHQWLPRRREWAAPLTADLCLDENYPLLSAACQSAIHYESGTQGGEVVQQK